MNKRSNRQTSAVRGAASGRWAREWAFAACLVLLAIAPATASSSRTDPSAPAGAPVREPSSPAGMVLIPAGAYEPVLRGKDDPTSVAVPAFWIDVRPVTNGEFLGFVRTHPKWRRSSVAPLFADEGYLGDWSGDLELGPSAPADAPVVKVSWFAARAYAAAQGKRLPTIAEWERAASGGYTMPRGEDDPAYQAAALDWFAQPTPTPLPAVGRGRPNIYGVRDLMTLVWEWADDFNTALVTGDSRSDTGLDRTLFCGAGAVNARDLTNYPAFMRAGFRSSLRASYVVPNLGFRCARSLSRSDEAPANPPPDHRL